MIPRILPVFLLACTACPRSTETRPIDSAKPSAYSKETSTLVMPRNIGVPGLELSGVVWWPALDRYLLVSDDLEADGKKHLPWLFTMTRDGAVDADPLVIPGIDELDDPESICGGPQGTILVATSHSVSKHGKLPASRKQLLMMVLVPGTPRTLKVLAKLDLTEGIKESSLDIEAISVRGDALYIGLKSPLNEDGSAKILVMPDLTRTMESGHAGGITEWTRPRLCLPTGVCQGVADMTFMPDGSLYLLGNAPKGGKPDGGGALWKMEKQGATPVLLKHFGEGLKPEGVTIAADAAGLAIVFDTDRAPPRWTRWPF